MMSAIFTFSIKLQLSFTLSMPNYSIWCCILLTLIITHYNYLLQRVPHLGITPNVSLTSFLIPTLMLLSISPTGS